MADESKVREILGVMREDETCLVMLFERRSLIEVQIRSPGGSPCLITADMARKLAGQLKRLADRLDYLRITIHD